MRGQYLNLNYHKEYYLKHKKEQFERVSKWQKENRDKVLESQKKYRQKLKLTNPGYHLFYGRKRRIKAKEDGLCILCFKPTDEEGYVTCSKCRKKYYEYKKRKVKKNV